MAARRRAQREADVLRLSEEHKRRTSQILDMELTRAQLQAEKMVTTSNSFQGLLSLLFWGGEWGGFLFHG